MMGIDKAEANVLFEHLKTQSTRIMKLEDEELVKCSGSARLIN